MYNCCYCEYKSNKKYNLDRHINTKHKNNTTDNNNDTTENNNDNHKYENKCIKCNKMLSSKQSLKKHLLICKGVSNPLECHLCHKIYYDSSSKSRHLKKCKENNIIEETKKCEYIYLVQEREFIKTNEHIYKIGKTKQECLKRIKNYPNGTKLIIQIECNDCDKYEKLLITKFKKEFFNKKKFINN